MRSSSAGSQSFRQRRRGRGRSRHRRMRVDVVDVHSRPSAASMSADSAEPRSARRPARRARSAIAKPTATLHSRQRSGDGVEPSAALEHRPASERFIGVTNSDLAFTGNYAIQGNYNGYQVWDISNPAKPDAR